MKQEFKYDGYKQLLMVTTTDKNNKGEKHYVDTFTKKQTKEFVKALSSVISNDETLIENYSNQLTDSKNVQKSELKLTVAQVKLMEDLKVLQRFKPIEDAKIKQKQLESELKLLKKELSHKQTSLQEIKDKVSYL